MGKPPTMSPLVSAGHCSEVPAHGDSQLMSSGCPALGTEGILHRMSGSRIFLQEIRGLHGWDFVTSLDWEAKMIYCK